MERLTSQFRLCRNYHTKAHIIPKRKDMDGDLQKAINRLGAYEDTGLTPEECRAATRPRPLDEWHPDDGPVLWWMLPVSEPPYVGSPDYVDWPGYHTHWTPLILPREVTQDDD